MLKLVYFWYQERFSIRPDFWVGLDSDCRFSISETFHQCFFHVSNHLSYVKVSVWTRMVAPFFITLFFARLDKLSRRRLLWFNLDVRSPAYQGLAFLALVGIRLEFSWKKINPTPRGQRRACHDWHAWRQCVTGMGGQTGKAHYLSLRVRTGTSLVRGCKSPKTKPVTVRFMPMRTYFTIANHIPSMGSPGEFRDCVL